jgi:4-amino-4-deoxy-L-arabinose transferase-like glycosyltransferase
MKQRLRSLPFIWLARIFWLVTAVALLLLLLILPRSPLPWLDEIFYASAALAVVRGGPPVPTVLAAFPHTLRLDLLYGPMISFLGSLEVKFFGLSATSWRMLGFAGGVGTVFSAAWVSRRLDRSPVAVAAAAMMVALSQGMGARATSGRFDTITTTLELLSLACVLVAMRAQELRRSGFVYAALAGIFCGLAALSTPRSFPFILGLSVAMGLELALVRKWELVVRAVTAGVAALVTVGGWTFSLGMSPIGWLRFVAAASQGDKINVSPILHGTWHLLDGPLVPLLSGLFFVLLMILVFGGAMLTARHTIEAEGQDANSGLRLASITVLINYVALFLMISRFWDYEIFVVPLVVPVLMALTAKILRSGGMRTLPRMVLVCWLLLATVLVGIRSGKVVAWLASYGERDPQPLQDFISSKVPSDARVFGPEESYFYAVEAAGSHYLFVRPHIPTGLIGKLDHPLDWREQLKDGQTVYLIWAKDETLPRGLTSQNLRLEGSFTAQMGREPSRWRKAGWGSGYPPTNLYQIVDVPSAEKNPAK